MNHRVIETIADLEEGTAALTAVCRHMQRVHELTGVPPLRRRPAGFSGLARVIVGQQLSIASAGAIWNRVEALVQPFEPQVLLRKREVSLRTAGLSAGKIATLRATALACRSGQLDLDALAAAPDDQSIRVALTLVKGIGPWTADIYTMFCLGRADAWSPGDLALKYAVQDAMRLRKLPDEARMIKVAEAWRPWRAVAAGMLWRYYHLRRKQHSVAPV